MNRIVLSGLTQIALGAATGFPYALAVTDADRLRRAGIKAPQRIRQFHLDLIIMGSLVAMAGTAVPDMPRWVAAPLVVGGWTNALSFVPPALAPEAEQHPVYRSAVAASFATTAFAWVALAAVTRRRLRAASRRTA
ncbi:hypothetical protein [Streptomyces diastatochromogenes]|uniref:hypothetical protein n=1 Tax=Streptomyces diastatochromogenes TaxID=42236 RepID=UPI001ABF81AC|nr:hypothetical protein [Streptomyces diastatochromogenes]MCZ0985562.1 hypothetical protein [Streptomyces diastatochromogenes]